MVFAECKKELLISYCADQSHSSGSNRARKETGVNHVGSAERHEGGREDKSSSPLPPSALEPNVNLSRDELLKLLSVFEGELQARDEVIAILKTECSQNSESRWVVWHKRFVCRVLSLSSRDESC